MSIYYPAIIFAGLEKPIYLLQLKRLKTAASIFRLYLLAHLTSCYLCCCVHLKLDQNSQEAFVKHNEKQGREVFPDNTSLF